MNIQSGRVSHHGLGRDGPSSAGPSCWPALLNICNNVVWPLFNGVYRCNGTQVYSNTRSLTQIHSIPPAHHSTSTCSKLRHGGRHVALSQQAKAVAHVPNAKDPLKKINLIKFYVM